MIIGHIGIAFGAQRRWQRIPLAALLVATFAPDILRVVFAAAGFPWRQTNFYSHALPWSAILGVIAGGLAWKWLQNGTAALVVFGVVMSHVALDMISGNKPLWSNGPMGLDLEHVEQAELIVESGLMLAGWYLLHRSERTRWTAHWTVPAFLIAFQMVYLLGSISQRPYATRCFAAPIGACTDASLITKRWNTTGAFW